MNIGDLVIFHTEFMQLSCYKLIDYNDNKYFEVEYDSDIFGKVFVNDIGVIVGGDKYQPQHLPFWFWKPNEDVYYIRNVITNNVHRVNSYHVSVIKEKESKE